MLMLLASTVLAGTVILITIIAYELYNFSLTYRKFGQPRSLIQAQEKSAYDILERATRAYYGLLKLYTETIRPIRNRLSQPMKCLPHNVSSILDIETRVGSTLSTCGSMYYVFDGYQRIIMIGSYKTAKAFYKTPAYSTITRVYPYLGYVFNNLLQHCIGTHTGKEWLTMKKPLTQFFTTRSVRLHYDSIIDEVRLWMDDLAKQTHTGGLALHALSLDKLTISILSNIVYGKLDQTDLSELYDLSVMHNKLMISMGCRMAIRIDRFCKFGLDECKLVDEFWSRWSAFNNKQIDRIEKSTASDKTLIDAMLSTDTYVDRRTMYQTLYEIMLFNSDIMVDSFANLIWNIASNPVIQSKLYAECNNVEVEAYTQIDELLYLPLVLNESARLNPGIVQTFAETINEPMDLNGYTFESGTMFSLDTQMINRDPDIWADPNTFDPSRFTDQASQTGQSGQPNQDRLFAFHRFGLSPRKCMGNVFADYILKIGVVMLLNKYAIFVDTDSANRSANPSNTERQTIPNLSNCIMLNRIKFDARV